MTIRRIRRGLHPRHVPVIAVTAFVEIGLRTTRLAMLVRYLAIRLGLNGHSTPEAHQPDPVVLSQVRLAANAVNRVVHRWPFGATCLRRALILRFLIRHLDPALRIGVRRDGPTRP